MMTILAATVLVAPWAVESYPDEAGFRQRAAATVPALAQQEFARRSLALSKCPDTGLPVRTFAVEGEEIISPYTGRRYRQGPTSYFGPKARGADGRITRFGGDPMKFELPPAAARLLVEPTNVQARAFLSIPGNMVQQYHFACVNWCRFYPLLAGTMGETWKKEFAEAVANYREGRKPSDGEREYTATKPFAHDLVGEENEFFGGNVADGGTENHKTMWRTSGLLYSQILGPDAKVSGYPVAEAERITTKVLTRGWQDILKVGNGEWDSSSYYPWQIRGFLNLYDFSPKAETRALAQFALDYYYATYGLKMLNGTFVGAQKRGFVSGNGMQGMDQSLWAFAPRTTQPVTNAVLWLHQATTKYRPNRVIANLITKNLPLPFEAQMARPTYHLKDKNAFQETFYCADGFALGSVAMTMEDNPGQQTVWSLGCRHPAGTFVFGGGQPKFRSPEGHSPYTQVVQKRGALIVMTAGKGLVPVTAAERWEKAATAAESWLFVPKGVKVVTDERDWIVLDAGEAWVLVRPIGGAHLWMRGQGQMADCNILVVSGKESGYVIEAVLKKDVPAPKRTKLQVATAGEFRVEYTSVAGDTIVAKHEPVGLRASATINGTPVDWSRWADGGVYASPYISVRDGVMRVSDGRETYVVDFTGPRPVWRDTP
jgi:hypothetical protein